MTIQPRPAEAIPEETRTLAWSLCPKGTMVMHVRDALGPIYDDEAFVRLYPKWGRPCFSVWRLALITVLQALEGLTDRQAAQAVQTRTDWRYALSLPLSYTSMDFTILSAFRQRLVEQEATGLLLDPILELCQQRGWLKAGGKQRTDSTRVLAAIRSLNSLESVGETMRALHNQLARQQPDWLQAHLDPDCVERYVHRFEMARFPKEESKRQQLREQVGTDVLSVLSLLSQDSTPQAVKEVSEREVLQRVFAQHYEVQEGRAHWRDGPVVANGERVISPYDQQARSSRKREISWTGYKLHVTETCDQDPERPHLVVQVHTTVATEPDSQSLEPIQQQLRARQLAPAQQYVDEGYCSGAHLAREAAAGTEVIGPVPAEGGWQVQQAPSYSVQAFEIDWPNKRVRCPQGQVTQQWSRRKDGQHIVEFIRFPKPLCQACPVHQQCTKGERRTLTLTPREAHEALQARRKEQWGPDFQRRYALRAGIEGTIAQAVQALAVRHSPYRGLPKTHLHHVAVAAALNLQRIEAHQQARLRGQPSRSARPLTPLAQVHLRLSAASP